MCQAYHEQLRRGLVSIAFCSPSIIPMRKWGKQCTYLRSILIFNSKAFGYVALLAKSIYFSH